MIIEYLTSKGLKVTSQGKEQVTDCPFCQKPKHLSINDEKGVWRCFVCGEAGNIWKLRKFYGDIQISQAGTKPKAKLPDQEAAKAYNQCLHKSKEAMEFLTRDRGLTPEIIDKFMLGYNDNNFNTGISIPYYESGVLVNIKYRRIDSKTYAKETGCKSTLYNIDNIDKTKPVILVEGEFDCISAVQLGYSNVISLPNGANSFDSNWLDIFDSVTDIYLCFDNDEAGNKAAEVLAKKIGIERCRRVVLPYKDFNDCLMSGCLKQELDKCFTDSKEYKLDNILHSTAIMEKIENLWKQGDNLKGLQLQGWDEFNEAMGGLREEEITVVTGETASGKSTWCLNIIYKLIKQGKSCFVVSNELKNEDVLAKLFTIHKHKLFFTFSKEDLMECMSYFGSKKLFFVNTSGIELDITRLEDYLSYARRRYDVEFVLLDHLHFFLRAGIDNQVQEIERFMRGLVRSIHQNKIHIFVIVHPQKLKNETGIVNMNDLRGSSAIKQDSFNIISLWRDREKEKIGFNDVVADFQKVRHDSGNGGSIKFIFQPLAQTYD